MTTTIPVRSVPPVRQDVIDRLGQLLAHDDRRGFAAARRGLAATRAEVAAAAAGLVDTRRLDLGSLEHVLEVLASVACLPIRGERRAA